MQTLPTGARWWFESVDRARKRQGAMLDRLGYSPIETPSAIVLEETGVRLRFYGGSSSADRIALIVPAPIKQHYIWDLAPECSVVQQALAEGMLVYMAEWVMPDPNTGNPGLDDYADRMLGRCIDAIRSRQRSADIFLLSHSLGGIFVALHAALHPSAIAGLVLIEAPLNFAGKCGSFGPMVAMSPPAGQFAQQFDRVPGSVLNLASVMASPTTFGLERYADLYASLGSAQSLKTHMRVERWTLDEASLPRRLFEQVVELLYRENSFMRQALHIRGKAIGPKQVTVPLYCVYDPKSLIIPPESVTGFLDAAGSRSKKLVPYTGDTGVALAHVGALVGENAHRQLWPDIFRWINRPGTKKLN